MHVTGNGSRESSFLSSRNGDEGAFLYSVLNARVGEVGASFEAGVEIVEQLIVVGGVSQSIRVDPSNHR